MSIHWHPLTPSNLILSPKFVVVTPTLSIFLLNDRSEVNITFNFSLKKKIFWRIFWAHFFWWKNWYAQKSHHWWCSVVEKKFLKVQFKTLFPRDCSPWSGEQKTYISYGVWIKTDVSIKRKLKKWVLPPLSDVLK